MQGSSFSLRTKMQFGHALTIAKKDARIYYLKSPVLIFGILFPVCLFLAFAIGRDIPPKVLLPGLVGMTLFFTASSANPIVAPWETRMRTLERLVSTPASISAIIFGDIFAGFLYGAVISIVPLLVGIFAFGATVVNPVVLAIDTVLGAFCFSALGSLLSSPPTDNPSNVMMLSNLVRLPLIFISGVFVPIENMPAWGKAIAPISPLTYVSDLARHSLSGEGYYPIPLDITLILVFASTFVAIGIVIHIYKIIKDRLHFAPGPKSSTEYMEEGRADVSITYSNCYYGHANKNALIEFIPTTLHKLIVCKAVVFNSCKRPEIAEKFVEFLLTPENQKRFEAAHFKKIKL